MHYGRGMCCYRLRRSVQIEASTALSKAVDRSDEGPPENKAVT